METTVRDLGERLDRAERRIAELGSIAGYDASRVLQGLGIGIQAGSNITITKSGSLLVITGSAGSGGGNDLLGMYGDGRDGNVTIGVTTTLTRDMYYDTLTVNAQLNPDGWRIFCKTALIVGAAGVIDTSGLAAILRVGGGTNSHSNSVGVGKSGAIAGGALGGTGAGVAGTGATNSQGMGGSSGTPGAGGAGTPGAAGAAGAAGASVQTPPAHITDTLYQWSGGTPALCAGGAVGAGGSSGGGDGANNGGNGGGAGGSGGIIFIAAKTITNSGTISSQGGAGYQGANAAAGNCGGGGGGAGGGGGGIYLVYDSITVGTITVAGGAGGAAGNGIGTGVAGSVGSAGSAGIILRYKRTTGVWE